MKIKKISWALAGVFLLSLSIVLASLAEIQASDKTLKDAEITGIVVLDHAIRITTDAPITYKINHTDDPFRVTVDIERARLGFFSEKMYPDRAGVTEINPIQILKPSVVARLNILLQAPAMLTPEVRDNVLLLTIKEDGKAAAVAPAEADTHDVEKAEGASEDGDENAAEDSGPAYADEITGLRFSKTADGAAVVLKGDGTVPEPVVYKSEGRVIVDIADVETDAPLPSDIALPVKGIQYRKEKDKLRFIIDMEPGAKASVAALDDELIVNITSSGTKSGKTATAANGDCRGGGKKQPVSFDMQDADIVAIMGILNYDMTGCNIVVNPDDVKGKKISMKLYDVPWNQALDIILKTFGLEKVVDGNVIRIITKTAYQEEQKSAAAEKELVNIETKIFIVNYANVDKVKDAIDKAKLLTSRGNISTDPRTRSIIVKDIPSSLEEMGKLVETLDKPTRQVLIEARIVEVSKNFSNELGVEWSGYLSPNASRSAMYGVGSASSTAVSGATSVNNLPGATGGGGGTTPTVNPLASYFPTLVSLGTSGAPTGAFTVGYLNAARTLGLDLRISALESNGKGKIVSSPKIMTLDNEKAVIKQGRKIPYSTVSNSGTQVQFIDAALGLTVTPQIGPDNTILLTIVANKDSADFSNTSQGLPSITTNEASTQVLIKDGETVVMGGILSTTDQDSESNIPGLSKIPLLGALFKRNAKTTSTDELLIFITPRVIEQQ
ncbi:MAG: type IV pilus secretin PilQ [Nitrospirae bacterium]|nr:type IV pilus secretin PilQ [Nitrospirota bacterium]